MRKVFHPVSAVTEVSCYSRTQRGFKRRNTSRLIRTERLVSSSLRPELHLSNMLKEVSVPQSLLEERGGSSRSWREQLSWIFVDLDSEEMCEEAVALGCVYLPLSGLLPVICLLFEQLLQDAHVQLQLLLLLSGQSLHLQP